MVVLVPLAVTCERRTHRCLQRYRGCEIAVGDRDSVTPPSKLACAASLWQATRHGASARLSDALFCQALGPLKQETAAAAGLISCEMLGHGGHSSVIRAGNAAQLAFPELGGTSVCNF